MTLISMTRLFRSVITLVFALTIAFTITVPAAAQEYKEAYNAALTAAKANNLPEALQKFTLAANGAKAAGDTDVERRSNKVISQIEYKLGLSATQGNDFAGALTHFDNGITRSATYSKNYLGRGLALKKLNRIDEAMTAFQQAIEVGDAESDRQTSRAAQDAIRDHYVYIASSALNKNGGRPSSADIEEAMTSLAKATEYLEADSDILYYTALAFKAKGDLSNAVASANKALELHRGSKTDKAKIYFVKGEALVGLGDAAGAKAAFTEAAVGQYKASAEHYLESLGS